MLIVLAASGMLAGALASLVLAEQRLVGDELRGVRARTAARSGLARALGTWAPHAPARGQVLTGPAEQLADASRYSSALTVTGEGIGVLRVEGQAGRVVARMGVAVRLVPHEDSTFSLTPLPTRSFTILD